MQKVVIENKCVVYPDGFTRTECEKDTEIVTDNDTAAMLEREKMGKIVADVTPAKKPAPPARGEKKK